MESSLLGRNVSVSPRRRRQPQRLPLHGRRQLRDRDPVRLLVTGAAGMLGHERRGERASGSGHEVAACDLPELDLTDAGRRRRRARRRLEPRRGRQLRGVHGRRRRRGRRDERRWRSTRDGAGQRRARGRRASARGSSHVSTDYVFDGDEATTPWRRVRRRRTRSAPTARRSCDGRGAGRRRLAATRDRAHRVAVRRRRPELRRRRCCAWPPSATRSGRDRPGRLARRWPATSRRRSSTWPSARTPAFFHVAGAGHVLVERADARDLRARPAWTAACCRRPREQFARPAPRPACSVLGTERERPVRCRPWQRGRSPAI